MILTFINQRKLNPEFLKVAPIASFRNRPDVRLYHNRHWLLPSGVGRSWVKSCKSENENVMKEEKVNRTKWLHIRLTKDEHKKINDRFKETTCRKLSDYARRVLLDKKITTLTRNQSLDDFMAEMIRLRNELTAIGNNWNQAVKRLHTMDHPPEMKVWIISTQKIQQAVVDKTEEIKMKIGKISDQWLQ